MLRFIPPKIQIVPEAQFIVRTGQQKGYHDVAANHNWDVNDPSQLKIGPSTGTMHAGPCIAAIVSNGTQAAALHYLPIPDHVESQQSGLAHQLLDTTIQKLAEGKKNLFALIAGGESK
jgi:hypothetical protein